MKLDEQEKQQRMYNSKLNFETGHLTVPGKPSVKPEEHVKRTMAVRLVIKQPR